VHQTVTEYTSDPTSPVRERPSVGLAVLTVGFPASLLVAVATGLLAVRGVDRTELMLPLAALLGLGFVVLGLVRFEWFVLCALAVRTLVDVTKVGSGGGQVGSVTPAGDAVSSGPAASALAILFIALSVVWLLAQRRSGNRLRPTVADAAFGFFVGSCLLSAIGSVNRAATLTETARIVAAVLMFVVLERLLTSMQRVRRVLVACFVALAAPVGLGVYQAVTGHGRFETAGVSRVVGTFLHPNTFGFFLSMFMLMAIALYRHCEPRARLALALITGLCGILLVLTYSRGSWIAFTLGLVLIGLLQSRLVFAWIIGGALLTAAALPSVISRLSDLGTGNSVTGSAGNSLTWRLEYWAAVLQLNNANPVTGIGLKGTRFLTDQSKAPHNDFLRAYAETGALGLLAFLVVLVALVGIARRAVRSAAPGLATGVAVGFAAVLLAYLIDSVGDNLMSEVVVLWYVYAFAACAFAVARRGVPLPSTPAGAQRREPRSDVGVDW
jgi:O-antigen ligase